MEIFSTFAELQQVGLATLDIDSATDIVGDIDDIVFSFINTVNSVSLRKRIGITNDCSCLIIFVGCNRTLPFCRKSPCTGICNVGLNNFTSLVNQRIGERKLNRGYRKDDTTIGTLQRQRSCCVFIFSIKIQWTGPFDDISLRRIIQPKCRRCIGQVILWTDISHGNSVGVRSLQAGEIPHVTLVRNGWLSRWIVIHWGVSAIVINELTAGILDIKGPDTLQVQELVRQMSRGIGDVDIFCRRCRVYFIGSLKSCFREVAIERFESDILIADKWALDVIGNTGIATQRCTHSYRVRSGILGGNVSRTVYNNVGVFHHLLRSSHRVDFPSLHSNSLEICSVRHRESSSIFCAWRCRLGTVSGIVYRSTVRSGRHAHLVSWLIVCNRWSLTYWNCFKIPHTIQVTVLSYLWSRSP